MRFARLLAGLALITSLAGACTVEPNPIDAREEAYLARVRTALLPFRDRARRFDPVFQQTVRRERFLDGLKDIRAFEGIRRSGAQLQRIAPPPRFFGDIRGLLRALAEAVPVAEVAAEEASQDKVVDASVRHAQFVVTYERTLAATSPRFCQVAATTRREADLCAPLGILPGSTYGERLRLALARLSADFTPRGFLFVARAFSNEEVAQYLQRVQPSIVRAIERTQTTLRRLVPTDEFATDHRLLLGYFDQFVALAREISDAAQSDPSRLHALFPRSQQLVNRTRDRLSKAIRPAIAVWFFPSS
jgi:hypothetical protein